MEGSGFRNSLLVRSAGCKVWGLRVCSLGCRAWELGFSRFTAERDGSDSGIFEGELIMHAGFTSKGFGFRV